MDFFQVNRTRRSIRRYSSQPVPRALLEQILSEAIQAPSAHNRQPWRFMVIQDSKTKIRLAAVMGEKLRADLATDGVEQSVIEFDAERSYARITNAPAVIVVCLSMADMDSYSDEKRSWNEYLMAAQSVAMAGQNLLLAANSYGLGACWMCAPLFCQDEVRSTLSLPDDWQPQSLITIGYPAEVKRKPRNPLEKSVLWQ